MIRGPNRSARHEHLSLLKREPCMLRFLICSLFLLCVAGTGISPESADAAVVGDITVHGLRSITKGELCYLLGIQQGQSIDAASVRAGMKRAFLKGIFDDIAVDVWDNDPADVVIRVQERVRIRKVRVEGDYDVSRKRILDLLPLKQGDIMRNDLIGRSTTVLHEKLAYHGFPQSVVALRTEQTSDPYQIDLIAYVETGAPLLIREILITGDGTEAKDALRVGAGDVYDQQQLNDELRHLRGKLKKEGYYSPAVGPYIFRDGILEISINTGKRIEVHFEGNSALSEKRLAGEANFVEMESAGSEMIDETVIRMISLYHEKGYPFAQIAPVIDEDDREIRITYFIFEGARIKTRSVSFVGAGIPAQTLKDVMALKEGDYYNPGLLDADRESLKEFYAALGYLDAVVKEMQATIDREQGSADILVALEEGERTLISQIEIEGAAEGEKTELESILNIKTGDPYNEIDISDARFRILDFYAAKGYAHIDVLTERTLADHRVALRFNVIEGKKSVIGRTVIAGNEQTRYEAIRRELTLREGQPYSFRTLSQERQRLYRMGLFTKVDIEAVDAAEDIKDVLINVTEGNAGGVEFGFGIADYEKFRAFVEVSYRNLWGMNRQALLRTDVSSLHNRAFLQYHDPWFFDSTLPFRTLILVENKKEITIPGGDVRYRLRRVSVSAGVEKKLKERVKLELYYEFSMNRTSDVSPDVVLSKEDVGRLNISAIRPSLVYDSRDNTIDPSKGIVAGINAKWATPLLLSESDFVKFTFFGSLFQRLSKRVVGAFTTSIGIAYGLGDAPELPIIERYFLGGRSSVRGYAQDTLGPKGANDDPTGGNASFMASVELRTAVGWGFSIVPFVDCGNVWVKASEFSLGDLKYTAGLGVRYATPVGPLRVDYGYKLNRESGESAGELHFSIGQAF